MKPTKVESTQPDKSEAYNRMVFVIRYIVPVFGLALIALIAWGAVAYESVRIALLVLLALLAGLAVAGGIYQAYAARRDRRNFPPAGTLADAGGSRLHLLVMGEDTGKPTVLLEGGMASFTVNWHWVQTELAKETRVVAYDRAGFGWSENSPHPRDALHCARELHTALHNAGISGPYVLAGWSFGGLVVRVFAGLYPDEVVGLALVDASHPDQWLNLPVKNADRMLAKSMQIQAELCRFGFGRINTAAAKAISEGLPEPQRREIFAWCALRDCYKTEGEQAALWTEVSRVQVNNARLPDNLPVYVISVTEQALYGEVLSRLQEELITLSANSTRTVIQGATHESLVAKQEYATAVANAIRQVITSAQNGNPLAG